MKTRSQSNINPELDDSFEDVQINPSKLELKIDINFDEASSLWKANKKPIGNGMYRYICGRVSQKGKVCQKIPMGSCTFCKRCIIYK
jgi:hypothetical protein